MSARDEVYTLVQSLLLAVLAVDGATGPKLIKANQRAPRPAIPYIAINVLQLSGVSESEKRRDVVGLDVEETGTQVRDARITLQAFGEPAVAWLESLPLRFGWPAALAIAAAREISPPKNITDFLDTGFMPRAECEIGVYVSVTDARAAVLVGADKVLLDEFGTTHVITLETP